MRKYEIRDPVHGFIQFNKWERDIINHPVFQRLRRIRQLAFTDLVYPGAMHTRFEHSLGVMHLATKMYDAITRKERNLRLLKDLIGYEKAGLEKDRQLVRLSALLHDIGHAPFSHASEELMPEKSESESYKHEDYTKQIILDKLADVIENHPINKTNYNIKANEVVALITGDVGVLGLRSFWKVLISSQLDADRGDYLLRDSFHVGVKYGIYDVDRLLVSIALGINPETESEMILGIDQGGWHVAETLITARYQMFAQVYYHKTRRAYDYMLKECLKEAIREFPSPKEIDKFLEYDDCIAWQLMKNRNSEWFRRMGERKHIKVVFETKEKPSEEEINYVEKLKEKLKEKNVWFWEDSPQEAKSWYKIKEDEEIYVIEKDGENVCPLSEYSTIVKSLQRQFAKSRIYVKPEDREKANKIKEEVEK